MLAFSWLPVGTSANEAHGVKRVAKTKAHAIGFILQRRALRQLAQPMPVRRESKKNFTIMVFINCCWKAFDLFVNRKFSYLHTNLCFCAKADRLQHRISRYDFGK